MLRRDFLRILAACGLGGISALALRRSRREGFVWQIDPHRCVQCGRCSDHCVLAPSAVKCVHAYDVCGFCRLCSGYYPSGASILDTAAENRLCPSGAFRRVPLGSPYLWKGRTGRS